MKSAHSFPRAIVHVDADSFFASVEQTLDHTLRGKVVVTGGERGAATSVSVEGKKLGLYRGMTLREMKRICPDIVIVPGDYTSYSIYAQRMYHIAREFTQEIEEYSIDECFADITGLEEKYGTSYAGIALRIKDRLENDLGITFGVGLAPNKTLAKIASKRNKPAGLTILPLEEVPGLLKETPIGSLWGMGFRTSFHLEKRGVHTAFDFMEKDDGWLRDNKMSKPYRDIWLELQGHFVRTLGVGQEGQMGSILQSRTFTPTSDRHVIFSALAKNIEGACAKARRHSVKAKTCRFYLKTQDFSYSGKNLSMSIPLSDPREFLRLVESHFRSVHVVGTVYRATGFGLYSILPENIAMPDLFGESVRVAKEASILNVVDRLNKKYGRHTLYLGASAQALTREAEAIVRRKFRKKNTLALDIDHRKKTINLPYLGVAR